MTPEEFKKLHSCAQYGDAVPRSGHPDFIAACHALKYMNGARTQHALGLSKSRWEVLCEGDVCAYYAAAVLASDPSLSDGARNYIITFMAMVEI